MGILEHKIKTRFIQAYIGLLFFVLFIYGINNQAIGTLITQIIEHYGIRMAQAGLLSSFTSAGNFAAIFIITIFVGRINKIILMGAGLFFFAVSLFLISIIPPFAIILVCFSLIGLFGATVDTLVNSLVADLQPDNVSRTISLLHGFFGLGGLCGPIIIEYLTGTLRWDQVYLVISIAFFIYLIFYTIFIKWQWHGLTTHMSQEKQARFGFSDIVQFFTRKRHVLLWIAMFLYGGNQSAVAIWIKRYVETYLNVPVWGAYALSAMWLGTAVCRLVLSPGIKASSPWKIVIGNLISTFALVAGLLSGSAPGITAAALLVGLSSGWTLPLILALGCQWYPEKTALGTMMPFTAFFIAYVVFPPLSGFISDSWGIPWGVAVGAVCAFLTAVLAWLLNLNLKSEKAL